MNHKHKSAFSILCLTGWLVCGLVSATFAQEEKCDICGQKITGKFYTMEDRAAGGKVKVCLACADLEQHCFACGLPVKQDYKQLTDGRLLCARDARDAIESEAETRRICEEVPRDLNRMFSRFLTMPTDDVVISIVDRYHLESLFKAPGYDRACGSVFGATQSHDLPGGKYVHSISILSHLKKSRLQAVVAHEFAHAWVRENVSAERRAALSSDAVEGFCEWMAYNYVEAQHETFEMQVIKDNSYTRGQIKLLVDAENRYGFNTVLDWVKSGEDPKLEVDKPERANALLASAFRASATTSFLYIPTTPPPPNFDRLVLKAISSAGGKRLAVINNRSFEASEHGRVPLGETNVGIRCLEIRTGSAVVQVDGSTERQELHLKEN